MRKARLALIGTMAAAAVLGTTALANGTRLVTFYDGAGNPVETAAMPQEKVTPSGGPVLKKGETLHETQIPFPEEVKVGDILRTDDGYEKVTAVGKDGEYMTEVLP